MTWLLLLDEDASLAYLRTDVSCVFELVCVCVLTLLHMCASWEVYEIFASHCFLNIDRERESNTLPPP